MLEWSDSVEKKMSIYLNWVGFCEAIQLKTLRTFIKKLGPYFPIWEQAISS